ncbi:MAG: DUF4129 domain-containing protein, partial [Pseudomonadota bacterium]
EAATRNGLRLARSWTARDALARIPAGWPGRAALADLARGAELAHFGGRAVDEATFQHHLASARALFAAGPAATRAGRA